MDATSRPRRLIVTVHGIRTFGQWQERLEALVRARDPDARVLHYKYGYFSSIAFMLPFLRWWVTRRFRSALLTVADDEPWTRVDVVAHSFGTHLVGWGLHGIPREKRPRVHTLILAGSVLKPTFPWPELTENGVHRVVNDCGTRDTVLVLNQATVLFSGMAGRVGFAGMNHDRFRNRFFAHGHSGYFVSGGRSDDAFMSRWWLPVLLADERVEVPEDPRDASAAQGVASFVLNNAEPIKLALVAAPFALLALVYFRLYDDADRERAHARSRLTALQVRDAERRADAGDVATAMLWYVEALRTSIAEPRDAAEERDQRVRLATARGQLPRLALVLTPDDAPRAARLDPAGDALALAEGETVRVWDVDAGSVRTPPITHASRVNAVAFGADGALLATASSDRTARVWDARTGVAVTPPFEHDAGVNGVAFCADDTRVLTTADRSPDGRWRVRVWDARTGAAVGAPASHDGELGAAELARDGTRAAAIFEDGTTLVWTPGEDADGLVIEAAARTRGGRPTLAFDAAGERLATCSGWQVETWDARTGARIGGPWIPGRTCRLVDLDVDGAMTVDGEGNVELWGGDVAGPLWGRERHGLGPAAVVEWSRPTAGARCMMLIARADDVVRVWQMRIETPRTALLRHTGAVRSAFVADSGRRAVTIDAGGVVRVWDLGLVRGIVLEHAAASGGGGEQHASFTRDGARVMTWANGASVAHVWDAASGERVLDLPHDEPLDHAALSADGARVVTAAKDGAARVWDARTGEAIGEPRPHPRPVRCAAFSPDGRRLVTGCDDGMVRVWDAAQVGEPLATIEVGPEILVAAFGLDGRTLLVAGGVVARLYDATSGARITTGDIRDESGVWHAALSDDGRLIATAGMDGEARVWDAVSGEPITPALRLSGLSAGASYENRVERCAFSPDASLLATSTRYGSAYVWDARTGVLAAPPLPDGGACVAFSPDGRWIATGGGSGIARVWNARTGAAITPPLLHDDAVTSLELDARGERLLAGSLDGEARVWDLRPDSRDADAIARAAELDASRRVDASGGVVELSIEELRARAAPGTNSPGR